MVIARFAMIMIIAGGITLVKDDIFAVRLRQKGTSSLASFAICNLCRLFLGFPKIPLRSA